MNERIASTCGGMRKVATRAAGAVAIALGILVSGGVGVTSSAAEQNWWEQIPGFGPPSSAREPQEAPKSDPMDDLRADSTPWRSDEMVRGLERAIEQYQQLVSAGGWPVVPTGQPARMMRPGDNDERVPLLRKRLIVTGDMPRGKEYYSDYEFGPDLEAGVRRFQSRNGLRVSGRVDQPTFAALNVTAEARLAQLKLNLNRIRELLAQRVEDRYILVNVPAFQLEAVEKFEVQERHRVIVGRVERQTPAIKATVKALNFFPYWRVPDSVAHLDLIPKLRKEPEYLENERIRVFAANTMQELDPRSIDWTQADYQKLKFKQDPGERNALGLVRIDMSNPEGVYMHDTPMKKLFDQRGRAFSAGCVRVQGVFKLAEWIAKHEVGWEQAGRVQDVLNAGQALDVNLTRPMPVYFTYITAWAEPNGTVAFRPDLYNRDGRLDLVAGGERDASEGPAPAPQLAP